MRLLHLHYYPDPVLRTPTEALECVRRRERLLLEHMLDSMRQWRGVGLAAPQIGISLRLITLEAEGSTLALANPWIIEGRGVDEMAEGCLSLPGEEVSVRRHASVWIKGLDSENRTCEMKLSGLLARIVQHEVDHLNGILIIDHRISSSPHAASSGDGSES